MTRTTRTCAIATCPREIARGRLMCGPHWFAVPKPLRDEVWRTYDHGRGILSEPYLAAVDAAIENIEQAERVVDALEEPAT